MCSPLQTSLLPHTSIPFHYLSKYMQNQPKVTSTVISPHMLHWGRGKLNGPSATLNSRPLRWKCTCRGCLSGLSFPLQVCSSPSCPSLPLCSSASRPAAGASLSRLRASSPRSAASLQPRQRQLVGRSVEQEIAPNIDASEAPVGGS